MLEIIESGVQILFLITVGVVTVLTFIQARKTILQPLRAEVFKLQLEQMREVLEFFVGRDEEQLVRDAYLEETVKFNIDCMMQDYVEDRFPVKVKGEFLLDGRAGNLPENYPRYHFLPKGSYEPLSEEDALEHESHREEHVQDWLEHAGKYADLLPEFQEYTRKISSLMANPMLPSKCVALLEDYASALNLNANKIPELKGKFATQVIRQYPTFQEASHLFWQWSWMRKVWRKDSVKLEPLARRIVEFAREYFDADEFAPRN